MGFSFSLFIELVSGDPMLCTRAFKLSLMIININT